MVPGSPRSGHDVESCVGPQPVAGLPADSQPGTATAEESNNNNKLGRT